METEEQVVDQNQEVTTEETPVNPEGSSEEKPVDETDDKNPNPDDKKEETETDEKDPPKKTHDQRRWERLVRERAEFKAKAELLERMNKPSQEVGQYAEGKKPQRSEYPDDESYVEALTDYKLAQRMGAVEQKIAQQQQQAQLTSSWNSQLTAARQAYSDFDDVMEDANNIPITPQIQEALMSSENGADIAYYLASNPDEAQRVISMSPTAAIREIGRIESYIEYEKNQSKTGKSAISKAPPPVRPPQGKSAPSSKNPEDMTMDEYLAYRAKRRTKK